MQALRESDAGKQPAIMPHTGDGPTSGRCKSKAALMAERLAGEDTALLPASWRVAGL